MLQDDYLGFRLAQGPDLRELGFLYYVAASSEMLGDALQQLTRYSGITNEGVSLKYLDGKNTGVAFHYIGVSRHLDRHQIEFFAAVLVRGMPAIHGHSPESCPRSARASPRRSVFGID